jgi:squalene-associated FAD-dependent desaturase
MHRKEIIIIGGGVAGIAAAVAALEKGWKPVLLERTGQLGGRVRSLYAKDAGSFIDNGQHVLSASYAETRWLLSHIGSLDKVDFQKRLSVDFRLHRKRNFYFRSWPLPAPLHFLLPLLSRSPLAKTDRKFLYRWARITRQLSAGELKRITVREWLDLAGKAPFLEQLLWEPLTLATLNTPLKQASAFLLHRVLEEAFLGTSRNSGLGIPRAMLSDIFAAPAEKYIRDNGGEIQTLTAVKKLLSRGDRITEIETAKGERIKTPALILAIPPHALVHLMADSPGLAEYFPHDFSRFRYAPIITINLWFKKPLPGQFPMALVDSPLQWIFKLPQTVAGEEKHGYTVVISAAFEMVEKSQQEILQIVEREFRYFFAESIFQNLQLLSAKIVKEKSATILQTPQSLKWRPSPRTAISNLFLAGDWIDTGLPATIESAVLSGKMSVTELEKKSNKIT